MDKAFSFEPSKNCRAPPAVPQRFNCMAKYTSDALTQIVYAAVADSTEGVGALRQRAPLSVMDFVTRSIRLLQGRVDDDPEIDRIAILSERIIANALADVRSVM
jgi:hypothetical protein